MKLALICISQNGRIAAPRCLEGAGKSSANAGWRGTYLLSKGKIKKHTRRRGQTVKGLSGIHLLTCSRCAWLMSSSFGGEHMSTAAVPPSMGGDCARANCIPGSPAKSEPSELSHFLQRASAFHLIYTSHSPRNLRPSTGRPNRWLPGLMRSPYRCGSFTTFRGRCATAVTHFPQGAALLLLNLFHRKKHLISCKPLRQTKMIVLCERVALHSWYKQTLIPEKNEHVLQLHLHM